MNSKIAMYACFMLLGVFISSLSQVLLKKEAVKEHKSFISEYLNVRVIVAYSIFFSATLLSLIAYKVVPLSYGAIIEATSYIYVTIFGVIFFKEKVNAKKLLALILILAGIVVFTFF
ncbi:MAG: EamA family transporter [Lachnospiraceae bacterium]|nr:EamA family transporter [Lachnospiraceae bacterium]